MGLGKHACHRFETWVRRKVISDTSKAVRLDQNIGINKYGNISGRCAYPAFARFCHAAVNIVPDNAIGIFLSDIDTFRIFRTGIDNNDLINMISN